MSKWFDANGVDVDAYPDRAFKGGVYEPRRTIIIDSVSELAQALIDNELHNTRPKDKVVDVNDGTNDAKVRNTP